ncbi:MAG: radical SAM protein [Paludibacter sp.]
MRKILSKLKFAVHIFKYLTFKKLLNICSVGLSYMFAAIGKNRIGKSLPYFLSVEVANYCNLQCPECPVGNTPISKTKKNNIDFDLYKKIVDEHKPTLIHLLLYFQGEPLLNKQLPELIKYAHNSGIFTSTSTNGQLLTKNNAKLIVQSGLEKLIVSIDGTTQETYEKYRVGGELDKALAGIQHVNFWKNEFKSITPIIEIQFLVLRTNEHQIGEMRRIAAELDVDRLVFKSAQHYDFENGNERMTSISRFSRYKKTKIGTYRIKGSQPNRCFRLLSGGVINAGGEVLPCCYDKMSEFSFGNIKESAYTDCYQNKKASGFRGSILRNRKQFQICRNCTG